MAWTEFTRRRYERSGGKYASDATDAEWALIAPLMPAVRRTGRPRTTDLREVFNAILYIATTGCQWRMLPNDFGSIRVSYAGLVDVEHIMNVGGAHGPSRLSGLTVRD